MDTSGAQKRLREATSDDDDPPPVAVRRQPYRAVKSLRRPDPVPRFPPEIWEYIFRQIPERWQLLRLRQVCHCWRDVISGSPSLMSRFNVRLEGGKWTNPDRMDGTFQPVGLPPLIVKLTLCKYWILAVDGLWPAHGMKLKELRLEKCRMSAKVLYGMLRQAMNLKRLTLDNVELSGTEEPDFQLTGLKSLSIQDTCCDGEGYHGILARLEHVFPQLVELTLLTGFDSKQPDIQRVIRALQGTLKHLNLSEKYRGTNFVAQLCEMKQLCLKSMSLGQFPTDVETWYRFCRMQPQLEMLSATVRNYEILQATGRILTNLKRLTITVIGPLPGPFLSTLPGLEILSIYGRRCAINLYAQPCRNLKRFELFDALPEGLTDFLQHAPKLEHLGLGKCEIRFVRHNLPSLRSLLLDDIDSPMFVLSSLFGNCPKLEELHLVRLGYFGDEMVRECGLLLKNLRKLSLIGMRCVTGKSANHIVKHYRKLEELYACFEDDVLDRIKRKRKIRTRRHVLSDTEEDDDDDDDD